MSVKYDSYLEPTYLLNNISSILSNSKIKELTSEIEFTLVHHRRVCRILYKKTDNTFKASSFNPAFNAYALSNLDEFKTLEK